MTGIGLLNTQHDYSFYLLLSCLYMLRLLFFIHSYTPRDPSMNSETYHYKRGANQQFSQVCHVFDPSQYTEENLLYNFDREVMPIVIFCIAEEGEGR